MEKDLTLTELFEIYKGLLTEKQREMFSSYYIFDLSLSEIAEPLGTTRQNAFESLKKVKEKLVFYESILGLKEKYDALYRLAGEYEGSEVAEKIVDIIGG